MFNYVQQLVLCPYEALSDRKLDFFGKILSSFDTRKGSFGSFLEGRTMLGKASPEALLVTA